MKSILFISFLYLIPYFVMSQKVTVQVIKTEKIALSEWQILNDKYEMVLSGNDYSRSDSITFTLEANKRYFLRIFVSEIFIPDTSLYSLHLNGEPIILISSEIEPGDHFSPFFTGIRTKDVKITGGTDAVISDFPWQIYYESGDYVCGGSIISENWVITAAHCTRNASGRTISPSDMIIKAGATDPFSLFEGTKYYISEVIVHEAYNNKTLENDIALLKLEMPVNIENAEPIKLISADDVVEGATDPGVMSWVTGWGLSRVRPEVFPDNLQKVQLPIVSNSQAAKVWGNIPTTVIMAGYLNGNKDACSGDSGGPMVVPVSGEYKLAGIVSWGSDNCNTYGAYTRISGFETWIRSNTGIAKEYKPPSPEGDTIVCHGVESSRFSIEKLTGASAYEWELFPADAGVISGDSESASMLWNMNYIGPVTVKIRVTINNKVSDWSRLYVKIVNSTKLLSQSGDTTICAGQPINLNVRAEGHNLIYKWYHNGRLVQSGTSDQIYISSTSIDDSGNYRCEITGYCGTIYSGIIKLGVYPLTRITYISPDIKVPFGNNVTLEVNADGHDLIYNWQKNDLMIENSNSSRLLLLNVNATDIGIYMTTVTGTCGTETSDSIYVYVKKEDYPEEPEVFVWPTVTNYAFNVALSNDMYYNIQIFNTLGRLIRQQTNCRYQTSINVNNFPGGVYIIRVFNKNFRKSVKMIKK